MVLRQACGLRDSRPVMCDYNVPDEVQRCVGLVPATSVRTAK
ncbi:hypothetical protein [Bradyrhizobium centrolobii]|nr:hypothetical protein [Bradyrhizobium centrolobii]